MSSWSFSKYVRKAEKKARAGEKLVQLNKPDVHPVRIEGGAIARAWWGKAWNRHLESCAEYHGRLGKGMNSVRSGAVLDLQVSAGEIKALVQGSRAKPYSITIRIKKLNKNTWKLVTAACAGELGSLEELLAGTFPKMLEATFIRPRTGLFPSPKEIEFGCTCPDWASMCKHIAAALTGVGARFDDEPKLFFTLRGVDAGELVKGTVSSKPEEPLQKTSQKSPRMIGNAHLSAARGAGPEGAAGSATSDSAVEIQTPGEESVRMADVRKVLKKQLKLDVKLAKKEKPSKKSGVKSIAVKGRANEIVKKVVAKQYRPGENK